MTMSTISAALAADLAALTVALDDSGSDLQAFLQALEGDVRHVVASYLGLRLTVIIDSDPLTLTVLDDHVDPAGIVTSLRLPLTALHTVEAGSSLVLYAASPGAFVDFAADLAYALHLAPDAVAITRHPTAPGTGSGLTGIDGLTDLSRINQALGILIDQGHTPTAARAELHHLAHLNQTTPSTLAQRLIHATSTRRQVPLQP